MASRIWGTDGFEGSFFFVETAIGAPSARAKEVDPVTADSPLWTPSPERISEAVITEYLEWLKVNNGLSFDDYDSLWEWSVTEIESFWESIWKFSKVIYHSPYERIINSHRMPGTKWFEGATLNFAENILSYANSANRRSTISYALLKTRNDRR